MKCLFPLSFSAVLAAILGLAGCATTGTHPSDEIQGLSRHAVLLTLPYEAQNNNRLCGLASIEMVTSYYGKKLAETQAVFLRKKAEEDNGLTGKDLKKTLEDAGYFVAVFPGTLDRNESSLYVQLDQKRPLIAMIGKGPRHYVVVAGYDPDNSLIVLLDPARGRLLVPLQEFDRTWKEANHFILLASPETEDATESGNRK